MSGSPHFSPRRGFTVVGAVAGTDGPVVVHIHDSPAAYQALRCAADEAGTRGTHLVVVDGTGTARDDPGRSFSTIEDREREAVTTLLRNENVEIVDDDADFLDVCRFYEASLLVMGAVEAEALTDRGFDLVELAEASFDVMLVTDQT